MRILNIMAMEQVAQISKNCGKIKKFGLPSIHAVFNPGTQLLLQTML